MYLMFVHAHLWFAIHTRKALQLLMCTARVVEASGGEDGEGEGGGGLGGGGEGGGNIAPATGQTRLVRALQVSCWVLHAKRRVILKNIRRLRVWTGATL